jgi:response regulator of citrate/malate metabolism
MASGMDDLLIKPLTMTQLVNILQTYTEHSQQVSSVPHDSSGAVKNTPSKQQSSCQRTLMHKVVLHHTSELGSCKLALPTETLLTLTLKVMIGMGEVHPFI